MPLNHPVAFDGVHSKVMIKLVFIHFLLMLPLHVRFLSLVLVFHGVVLVSFHV